MAAADRTTRRAFTLIELLVVVAIIALLISILLPSLSCAREKARGAKCAVTLRGLGQGLHTYASENNDWIPGINTTGVAARVAGLGRDAGMLRKVSTPIQSYDWITPTLRHETDLGNNRALRLQTVINEYSCPSQAGLKIDFLYPPGLANSADSADFTDEIVDTYTPLSYLMPAHFQWWGQDFYNTVVAVGRTSEGRPITILAKVAGSNFAAVHQGRYQSRLDKLGPPADKIAAADGMRYLTAEGMIDFDVNPAADWFGAFASNGGWWCGAQAYGVASGTTNWDGTTVNSGNPDFPAAQGKGLVWSYRHGCVNRSHITQGVRDNFGSINAVFFDGHVALLDDRASREVKLWYPTGTSAKPNQGGLTDVVPDPGQQFYEVP